VRPTRIYHPQARTAKVTVLIRRSFALSHVDEFAAGVNLLVSTCVPFCEECKIVPA
jgi:hypothetical protein